MDFDKCDKFTRAYFECAMWATTGAPCGDCPTCGKAGVLLTHVRRSDREWVCYDCPGDEPNDDPQLQDHYELSDIDEATAQRMIEDCAAFQRDNEKALAYWYSEAGETPERAGHDFWLTREGHGAGFWDRWSSHTPHGRIGRKLTEACKTYGEFNFYPGDDGKIYHT